MARFTYFSKHALKRICQRTILTNSLIADVLDFGLAVNVGEISPVDKVFRLFFSPEENSYFVVVQNIVTGKVITLLPRKYYEHMNGSALKEEQLTLAADKIGQSYLFSKPCQQPTPQLNRRPDHSISYHGCYQKFGEFADAFYLSLVRQLAGQEIPDSDNTQLVYKEPGSERGCLSVNNGFYLGVNGQIVYNSNYISIFECDALAIGIRTVTVYQCLLKQSSWQKVKRSCLRKRAVLQSLFPAKEIACVVVSDNPVVEFLLGAELDSFFTVQHYQPQRYLSRYKHNKRLTRFAESDRVIPISHLTWYIEPFNYLQRFATLSDRINCDAVVDILDDMVTNDAVCSRLYWGTISKETFIQQQDGEDGELWADTVFVSISLESLSPIIRFHVIRSDNTVFRLPSNGGQPVQLRPFQVSGQELALVKDALPHRIPGELSALKQEIDLWHWKSQPKD